MKLLSAVSSKRMIMAKTKNQLACQWSEERNISKKQEKKKKKKKIEQRKKSSKQAKTKRKISEISEPLLKLTENRGNDKN